MEIKSIKSWCGMLVILSVAGVLSVLLINEGRKFSIEVMFSEINSIAEEERNYSASTSTRLRQELNDKVISQDKFDTEMSILKSQRNEYVCIDDGMAEVFSESQKQMLEKSLRSYYSAVYWGRGAIPERYKDPAGFVGRGIVIGYRADVYPGVVRIKFYRWHGLIGSGGGGTKVYVWYGSGFRRTNTGSQWVT